MNTRAQSFSVVVSNDRAQIHSSVLFIYKFDYGNSCWVLVFILILGRIIIAELISSRRMRRTHSFFYCGFQISINEITRFDNNSRRRRSNRHGARM